MPAWRSRCCSAPLHLTAAGAAADPRGVLLTGPLEPTNQWYAMPRSPASSRPGYRRQYGCDFVSVVPTNLMGRVMTRCKVTSCRLLVKAHQAKPPRRRPWRSGVPARTTRVPVDDAADGMVFLMQNFSDGNVNLDRIRRRSAIWSTHLPHVGYKGGIRYDVAARRRRARWWDDPRRLAGGARTPRLRPRRDPPLAPSTMSQSEPPRRRLRRSSRPPISTPTSADDAMVAFF